ncbi:MAG: hypothetical protein IKI45_16325, partial [Oscillospiraceae bacterium]|nr:hypothetical protein [Oscillospiraceae bacterium]
PSPKNDPPDRFIGFTPAELLTPGSFAVCGRRPEAPRLWTHRKLLKKFDQNFRYVVRRQRVRYPAAFFCYHA